MLQKVGGRGSSDLLLQGRPGAAVHAWSSHRCLSEARRSIVNGWPGVVAVSRRLRVGVLASASARPMATCITKSLRSTLCSMLARRRSSPSASAAARVRSKRSASYFSNSTAPSLTTCLRDRMRARRQAFQPVRYSTVSSVHFGVDGPRFWLASHTPESALRYQAADRPLAKFSGQASIGAQPWPPSCS